MNYLIVRFEVRDEISLFQRDYCQTPTMFNRAAKYLKLLICVILLNCINSLMTNGQSANEPVSDSVCVQKDLADVISDWRHKAPKVKPEGGGSLLLVPVIGTSPATGFTYGVAGQYAFKMNKENTLYSIFSINGSYTAKNQTLFQLKNNVYTKNNKIFFSGDWRYLIFSQPTYGLGTNSPEGGVLKYQYDLNGQETSSDSLAQPMNFNFVRFHQTVSFELKKGLYAGLGYHLDYYYQIVDQKLNLAAPLYTSHYTYNTYYGFNTQQYASSALNLNFLYDTRDNMINAQKGYFVQLSLRVAPKFMGNEKSSEFVSLEWRSFHGLSKRNPRHLVSFWVLGNFSPAGEFPYLALPALGYDQRGRSGRGYAQGRFRGAKLVYSEAEYRFPISRCGGIIGGVLFVNATTTDSPNPQSPVKLFNYIAPGYGFGFRMMVDKRSRTNLQLDFAFGNNSTGIYLGAAETF